MSEPVTDEDRVREVAARVTAAGPALRALGPERIARGLAAAGHRLCDPNTELGQRARETLPAITGLSSPMVEWALGTNVAPATPEVLLRLLAPDPAAAAEGDHPSAIRAPARLCVTVLAGNVFTAGLRAVAVPLLHGVPVVAKAPARDDAFPRLLRRALMEADPEAAPGLQVLTFAGGSQSLEDALFAQADVVQVHGSDRTVAAIRARLPSTTRFVPHGHGLGVAFVPADALEDDRSARRAARAVALDVAAFDQRGCLSPHAVFVERGAPATGPAFAELLAAGLDELAPTLPRGPLPSEVAATQVQWRGVAAARGALIERDGHAVSHEGDASMRPSPGWRNVAVLDLANRSELGDRLLPLGAHLKALGVAGDPPLRRELARTLPSPLAPRLSAAGEMQTPPIDALADGEPPWTGLVRWVDLR